MITLSYTITPRITQELRVIDALRTDILTTAIPFLTESRLRWTAAGGLGIDRRMLEALCRDWTGNPHPIQESDIEELTSSAFPKLMRSVPDTRQLLRFLNAAKDHPVIVAGVAFTALHKSPVGKLLFWMYLAKSGYDCRGMLSFTPSWDRSYDGYAQYTVWLEAYTASFRHACEALSAAVQKIASGLDTPHPSWQITKRQKQILLFLDRPAAMITNREVSRRCRVSQVTASRDLSHLTSLGLLSALGKGRSTAYTRL